jgi:hypothetical protein
MPSGSAIAYGTHNSQLNGFGSTNSPTKKAVTATQATTDSRIMKERSMGPAVFLMLK